MKKIPPGSARWRPDPTDLSDAPPLIDLCDRVGTEVGELALIRMWRWAMRHGPGPHSPLVLEKGARWTRKRGAFVEAALAFGFLRKGDGGLQIVDWWEVIRVDWSHDAPAETESTREQKADTAPATERTRRYRQSETMKDVAKALCDAAGCVTCDAKENKAHRHSDACVRHCDVRRDAAVTDRTSHETPNARVRTEKETQTEIENETENTEKNTQNARARDVHEVCGASPSPTTGPSEGVERTHPEAVPKGESEPPGKPTDQREPVRLVLKAPESDPKAIVEAQITEVLTYWREKAEHPRSSIEGSGSEKARTRIRARLRDGLTVADLKQVADGMVRDDWLMGRKEGARPGGWREVKTVYRDKDQCLALMDAAVAVSQAPVGRPKSTATMNTDAAYQDELERQRRELKEAGSSDTTEHADGERWKAAYLAGSGTQANEFRWGKAWDTFVGARKDRGIEELLKAADGLAKNPRFKGKGPGFWLSNECQIEGLNLARGSDCRDGLAGMVYPTGADYQPPSPDEFKSTNNPRAA